MPPRDGKIENLAHAYRLLDVPWDASPRAIKANYRKLIKRWHPDRHRPGTESHAEATLMTKLLNESYARIENAPLRNGMATPFSGLAAPPRTERNVHTEPDPSGSSRSEYIPHDPAHDATEFYRMMEHARATGARDDASRPFDWIGFVVRFVLGTLFGALMSFRLMTDLWLLANPSLVPLGVIVTILFCAFASAFGGDAFWRSIRPGGFWWWRRWD
jgi:curved DNA-binding protein CbpA